MLSRGCGLDSHGGHYSIADWPLPFADPLAHKRSSPSLSSEVKISEGRTYELLRNSGLDIFRSTDPGCSLALRDLGTPVWPPSRRRLGGRHGDLSSGDEADQPQQRTQRCRGCRLSRLAEADERTRRPDPRLRRPSRRGAHRDRAAGRRGRGVGAGPLDLVECGGVRRDPQGRAGGPRGGSGAAARTDARAAAGADTGVRSRAGRSLRGGSGFCDPQSARRHRRAQPPRPHSADHPQG